MTRLTLKEHIRAGTHPSCATPEQFAAWVKAALNTVNATYFCNDCTLAYETTMKLAGRCDKHANR